MFFDLARKPVPYIRLSITGVFMGLANLVPGVSGGTMVLALGLYDEFIEAMSSISRFRLTLRPLVVLALLFGVSAVSVLVFASAIQFTMEMFRPGMLALFIGMTLGGAPTLWKEMRPHAGSTVGAAVAGFIVMAAVALLLKPGTLPITWPILFIAGIIGSSAMILPGISGSYLLLIMGLYLPIIGGVSNFKDALSARDISLAISVGMGIILPVGLGVVTGIVAFSNLLNFLLTRHHKLTVGFLFGLLVGSVLGLYPFQTQSFDKLPRRGVTMPDGSTELRVIAHGWTATEGDAILAKLKAVETAKVSVKILGSSDQIPAAANIEAARAAEAVIIAFDQNVPRDVRRMADTKDANGKRVELVIVPDTRFSPGRAGLVVLLVLVGFACTILLGRFGGEEKPKEAAMGAPIS